MAAYQNMLRAPTACPCEDSISSNFSYFSPLPIEAAQRESVEHKVLPTNGLDIDPYEFVFEPSGDSFLHLNTLALYVKADIVTAADAPITEQKEQNVGPVNLLLNSMWSDIEVRVNDIVVNMHSSKNIAYKGIIESMLSMENNDCNFLTSSLFFLDTPGRAESLDNDNLGHVMRVTRTRSPFDMMGPVWCDIARSDVHLAPGVKLTLRFTRAPHRFVLNSPHAGAAFKLRILDICMYARRLHISEEVSLGVLKQQKHRYLTPHTTVKDFPLPTGLKSKTIKLYSGEALPKQVVIGFVRTSAKTGAYSENPFNFEHFNLSRINLKLNGMRVPQEPLTPDFDNKLYAREFNHVFMNTGKFRTNTANCITYEAFGGGSTLFPFDLTPDQCNGLHLHAGRNGTLELELEWSEPIPADTEGITVIAYLSNNQTLVLGGKKKLGEYGEETEKAPDISHF